MWCLTLEATYLDVLPYFLENFHANAVLNSVIFYAYARENLVIVYLMIVALLLVLITHILLRKILLRSTWAGNVSSADYGLLAILWLVSH